MAKLGIEDCTDRQEERRLEGGSLLLSAVATALGVFSTSLFLIPYLAGGDVPLSTFSDDFFYYLIIAENIASGHGSTFNGLVATNGYHPLWLLVVTGCVFVANAFDANAVFLVSICLIALSLWYLKLLFPLVSGGNAAVGLGLLSLNFLAYLYLAMTGMEVALLLPLLLCFVTYYRAADKLNYFILGFFASLAVLARLDAALFILLFLGFDLLVGSLNVRRLAAFGIGGLFVPVYLGSNLLLFGTLMPVSGEAKAVLELDYVPHAMTFRSFFHYDLPTSMLNIVLMLVWAAALLGLRDALRRSNRATRVVFLATLAFVPLYFLVTSMHSDWPIWRWYFFPLVFFLAIVSPILGAWLSEGIDKLRARPSVTQSTERIMALLGVALVFGYFGYHYLPILTSTNSRLHQALQIYAFTKDHPGIYAMGDRAGLVAYLIDQPVVQLEGLVMDREYLRRLEQADDLNELLNSYDVDYYVGIARKQTADGCYSIKEPGFSRGESRQIVSKLCWPREFEVKDESGKAFEMILKRPTPKGNELPVSVHGQNS